MRVSVLYDACMLMKLPTGTFLSVYPLIKQHMNILEILLTKALEMISNFSWDLANIPKDICYLEMTMRQSFRSFSMTLQMAVGAKITSVFGLNF